MEDLLHCSKSDENEDDSEQNRHSAEDESEKIKICDADKAPVNPSDPQ